MRGEEIARYEKLSDEAAMAACGRDEPGAFDEVFRRFAARVFGYLYHMTRDRELARDLVQETFLRVHRARERYDSGRPLKPWLFRIAANACADVRRSWIERLARRTRSLFQPPSGGADPAAPAGQRPDARAERDVIGERLRAELARLPPAYREAMILRDLEGLTCAEVAAALGKPLGTVLSLLKRGRDRLRVRLEAAGGKESWV